MKKIIVKEKSSNTKLLLGKIFESLLYLVGYAIILLLVSFMFKNSLYINRKYLGLYAFLASLIIHILNQTVKPILFYITLPITAITYGLFYPIVNVIILYITSLILGSNFEIHGIFISCVIAIIISILNFFMEGMIIKPIINKRKVIK